MDVISVATFAAVWFLLGMSPGPNAAFCVATGLAMSRRNAIFAPVGMAIASIPHVTLAAIGAGTIFARSASAFQTLKWVGVAYLAWLGLKQIRSKATFGSDIEATPSRRAVAARGLVVSLTNPKAILQYAAVLPQFVSPGNPVSVQFAVLGAVGVPIVFLNYTIYTLAAASISKRLTGDRTATVRRGVGGMYLLAAGLMSRAAR